MTIGRVNVDQMKLKYFRSQILHFRVQKSLATLKIWLIVFFGKLVPLLLLLFCFFFPLSCSCAAAPRSELNPSKEKAKNFGVESERKSHEPGLEQGRGTVQMKFIENQGFKPKTKQIPKTLN